MGSVTGSFCFRRSDTIRAVQRLHRLSRPSSRRLLRGNCITIQSFVASGLVLNDAQSETFYIKDRYAILVIFLCDSWAVKQVLHVSLQGLTSVELFRALHSMQVLDTEVPSSSESPSKSGLWLGLRSKSAILPLESSLICCKIGFGKDS